MTWELVSQVAIVILGTSSILLIARKNKWGLVVALAAQPFWFYTTYVNHQWGAFIVSFIYTAIWIYGAYEWFGHSKSKQ